MISRLFGPKARVPRADTHVEYWVYVREPKLIPQEVLLARLLRSSPFDIQEPRALGPEHGLLFSDIRLHVALVLREKNSHLFRPDLFETHIEPSPAHIEALGRAQAVLRASFRSAQPEPDRRAVRLLPHLAEALAYYGKGEVVFDFVAERLIDAEGLREYLTRSPSADDAGFHARAIWQTTPDGGFASSRGFAKIGLPDLITPESPHEERTVIHGVLEEAIGTIWGAGNIPEPLELEYVGGRFRVSFESARRGPLKAHIHRVNAR